MKKLKFWISKKTQYEKNFRTKEEILRKEEQEIAKQRTVLSAEAFKKKNNEFRKKVQSLQEKMQKASQLLQKAEAEAITTFGIIGIKSWIYKGEVFAKEFNQETNKVSSKESKE